MWLSCDCHVVVISGSTITPTCSHEQSCMQSLIPVSSGTIEYPRTTAGLLFSGQRSSYSRSTSPFSSLGSPMRVAVDSCDTTGVCIDPLSHAAVYEDNF